MRKLTFIILTILATNLSAQNSSDNSVLYFENCIINKTIPNGADSYKYEKDYRLIVWQDQLIKSYKYSNEAFDKLGYEYATTTNGDKNQYSKIYRKCDKNIVIEVTEWYNTKLSISIQWVPTNLRTQINYLTDCDFIRQNIKDDDFTGELYTSSYWVDIIGVGKGNRDIAKQYPIYENCKIIVSKPQDSLLTVDLGGKITKYKIYWRGNDGLSDNNKRYLLILNNEIYNLAIYYDNQYKYHILFFSKSVNNNNVKIWDIEDAQCPKCVIQK